jgi:hypothetical protein
VAALYCDFFLASSAGNYGPIEERKHSDNT